MPGQLQPLRGPRSALDRARPYLFTLLLPLIVLAVGSLIVEYGFRITPYGLYVLHWVEKIALGGLMLDPLLRLLLARRRVEMLRYRWFEYTLAGAFAAFVGVVYASGIAQPGAWARLATHVAIILSVTARLVEANQFLTALQVRPALLLVGSFLTLIALGTGLLLLPASTAPGAPPTSFTDALFTATSAVCVTGLVVVDTGAHWSTFGQSVILALIQLGGLGLMTFASVFALFLWRGLRVRESVIVQEAFTGDLRAEIRRVILFILLTTFGIEAIGAALLMGLWNHTYTAEVLSFSDKIYYSTFHSVAAFCNAGFGLYSDNLESFRSTWQANVVIPLLIITGGIGFGVLYNLARAFRYDVLCRGDAPLAKRRLTLQSKLAIATTVGLLAGGTGLVFVFETFPGGPDLWRSTAVGPEQAALPAPMTGPQGASRPAADPPMGRTWPERLTASWFLATTARTAGFNTVDVTRLTLPTKFLTVVLMFVGASPGSTGGGIKTVTFAVILCGVWAALRGRRRAQVFQRALPPETVLRAMAILALSVLWVVAISLALSAWGLLPGSRYAFLDCLFETTSGFATVGLSTGATPLLNTLGRILIVLTMFVGRVGPLTLFVAMQGRMERPRYSYATENVAIS